MVAQSKIWSGSTFDWLSFSTFPALCYGVGFQDACRWVSCIWLLDIGSGSLVWPCVGGFGKVVSSNLYEPGSEAGVQPFAGWIEQAPIGGGRLGGGGEYGDGDVSND